MTALDLRPIPVLDGQLEIPDVVVVPDDIEEAARRLAKLDGLATASEWARAAIVATYVTVSPTRAHVTSDMSPVAFAELGISGLKSPNSVRRYVLAWGDRPRPRPGQSVVLPADVFPKSAGAHVANNSGENEWYTPPAILDAARQVLGHIALDPASSVKAQETVRASVFFTAENDGLAHDWFGPIWMNPPYSQPLIGRFVDKLCSTDAESICLVNNATDTAWGAQLLARASAVCFLTGRVRFLDPAGTPSGAPLQGQMVTLISDAPDCAARFHEQFTPFGVVLRG